MSVAEIILSAIAFAALIGVVVYYRSLHGFPHWFRQIR